MLIGTLLARHPLPRTPFPDLWLGRGVRGGRQPCAGEATNRVVKDHVSLSSGPAITLDDVKNTFSGETSEHGWRKNAGS